MSEPKPPREHRVPVFGILLLFLLPNFDVLPWSLWRTLWRLWPVLLIITGISILLRRYDPWLLSSLVLAILFACLGIAIWQVR